MNIFTVKCCIFIFTICLQFIDSLNLHVFLSMALTLIFYNYEFIDTHCELKLIYQHKTMKQSLIINLSLRNEYLAISRIESNGLETGGEAFRNPECRSYSAMAVFQYFQYKV